MEQEPLKSLDSIEEFHSSHVEKQNSVSDLVVDVDDPGENLLMLFDDHSLLFFGVEWL